MYSSFPQKLYYFSRGIIYFCAGILKISLLMLNAFPLCSFTPCKISRRLHFHACSRRKPFQFAETLLEFLVLDWFSLKICLHQLPLISLSTGELFGILPYKTQLFYLTPDEFMKYKKYIRKVNGYRVTPNIPSTSQSLWLTEQNRFKPA